MATDTKQKIAFAGRSFTYAEMNRILKMWDGIDKPRFPKSHKKFRKMLSMATDISKKLEEENP